MKNLKSSLYKNKETKKMECLKMTIQFLVPKDVIKDFLDDVSKYGKVLDYNLYSERCYIKMKERHKFVLGCLKDKESINSGKFFWRCRLKGYAWKYKTFQRDLISLNLQNKITLKVVQNKDFIGKTSIIEKIVRFSTQNEK